MTCVRCERGDVLDHDQACLRERGGGQVGGAAGNNKASRHMHAPVYSCLR